MKNVDEGKLIDLIRGCNSKSEVCRRLEIPCNGNSFKWLDGYIESKNIDISHFPLKQATAKRKYPLIIKTCPVCGSKFETKGGHKREKTVCSVGCSNTYFRSGENNPNYKKFKDIDKSKPYFSKKYRRVCFEYHEHKCVICDEDKMLDVHHFDENRSNNNPENLIPICATHHNYVHSSDYKDSVMGIIIEYRDKFVKNSVVA